MAVLGLVLFGVAKAETPPDVVGDLGDPARWAIVGAKIFTADEIKLALQRDLQIGNASHRTESLDGFVKLLVERATDGYQSEGFPDCKIAASVDRSANQLVLRVTEGPRYRAGEIKIAGHQTIDAEELRRGLTTRRQSPLLGESPSDFAERHNGPVNLPLFLTGRRGLASWRTGDYATVDRHSLAGLRVTLNDGFFRQGRLFATFELQCTPDGARGVINLLIRIIDEGRPATVDRIVVIGGDHNRDSDILSLVGLAHGMVLTDPALQAARRRLSRSARFTKSDIKVEQPVQTGDPLAVTINVKPYDRAPPLGRPLSREEAALEKLGQWLNGFSESREEIVVHFQNASTSVEFVAAPQVGVVAQIREAAGNGIPAGPPTFAFVLTDQRVGFYSARRRAKLEAGTVDSPVWVKINTALHDVEPHSGRGGEVTFGVGIKNSPLQQAHCQLKFLDAPASMLALAYQPKSHLSWNGSVLSVVFDKKRIEFDADSGRLLAATALKSDDISLTFRSEPGGLECRLRQLYSWTAGWPNMAETQHPVSAALIFIFDDAIAHLSDENSKFIRDQLSAWRKAIAAGMLAAVDRLVIEVSNKDASKFGLPMTAGCLEFEDDSLDMTRFMFSRYGFEKADQLAPRGSWAWTLWRQAMLRVAGDSRHFHDELGSEFAHQAAGPLRNLCAALVLRKLGMNIESRVAAREGLAHLNIDDFRRDYEAILSSDAFVGECLRDVAHALGELDLREMDNLLNLLSFCGVFDVSDGSRLAIYLARLRRIDQSPADVATSRMLDTCWKVILENRFKSLLTELASSVPESDPKTARRRGPNIHQ